MPAIQTSVEVSETTITPKAFASDTAHPWVNIALESEHQGRTCAVHLSFASADEVLRLMEACDQALEFFDRQAPEAEDRESVDWFAVARHIVERPVMPACETEVIR